MCINSEKILGISYLNEPSVENHHVEYSDTQERYLNESNEESSIQNTD